MMFKNPPQTCSKVYENILIINHLIYFLDLLGLIYLLYILDRVLYKKLQYEILNFTTSLATHMQIVSIVMKSYKGHVS